MTGEVSPTSTCWWCRHMKKLMILFSFNLNTFYGLYRNGCPCQMHPLLSSQQFNPPPWHSRFASLIVRSCPTLQHYSSDYFPVLLLPWNSSIWPAFAAPCLFPFALNSCPGTSYFPRIIDLLIISRIIWTLFFDQRLFTHKILSRAQLSFAVCVLHLGPASACDKVSPVISLRKLFAIPLFFKK